jgi:hypothetical protein
MISCTPIATTSCGLVGAVARGLPGGEGRALAAHSRSGLPSQLPDFSPIVKDLFGIELPGHMAIEEDPFASAVQPLANPSMLWDFKGSLGLIEADGVSDPTRNSDGVA